MEEAISIYLRAEKALDELRSRIAAHTDSWSSLGRNLIEMVSLVHLIADVEAEYF